MMSEHEGPVERRPLVITDLDEKGWQKPVREPIADARPMGMPQASPAQAQPQGTVGGEGASGDQGAGGGSAQGEGDA
jgi:hypothetical protein